MPTMLAIIVIGHATDRSNELRMPNCTPFPMETFLKTFPNRTNNTKIANAIKAYATTILLNIRHVLPHFFRHSSRLLRSDDASLQDCIHIIATIGKKTGQATTETTTPMSYSRFCCLSCAMD